MGQLDGWFIVIMSILVPLVMALGMALLLPWPGDLKKRRGK